MKIGDRMLYKGKMYTLSDIKILGKMGETRRCMLCLDGGPTPEDGLSLSLDRLNWDQGQFVTIRRKSSDGH